MKVSQQLKEFGSKVKKDGLPGYYIYIGKNFTVKFNSDECEGLYWEVNVYEKCPTKIEREIEFENRFDTKRDLLNKLLNLDRYWND